MKLFGKKKVYENFPEGFDPVLRCSICDGEQVLCARDRASGELHEIMLIRSPAELSDYCSANKIDPESVEKLY